MKKKIILTLLCLVAAILMCCSYEFFKEKKEENLITIKLAEVTHSPFYAPFYVALEKGYFKDEGLDIDLILTPGADKVSAAVLSGDVEIGFAGPESAIYIYKGGEEDYLVTFAGLTKRDGQFIISKEKDFEWQDLVGKEILVGRKGGMPALNFLNALKNAGLNDLSRIVARYKESDSWLKNTTISEESYKNLEDLMIENNLLDTYVPFKELVKNFNE